MSDDTERNASLAAAMDDISAFALARMTQLETETGQPHQFLVLGMDGVSFEISGQIRDHNMMADAMTDLCSTWMEEGHIILIEDDDPLFTATFDPKKVRPQ